MPSYDQYQIATAMTQKFFIVPETTAGTAVAPAATDGVRLTAFNWGEQPKPRIPDEQLRNTHSPGDPIAGKFEVGTWTAQGYLKLPGALGTPCEMEELLYGLCGVQTTTGSTSDVFTLLAAGSVMPTFTLWWGNNIEARRMKGCIVKRAEFRFLAEPAAAGSVLQVTFSGEGIDQRRCIKDQLASDINGSGSTIVVTDGGKFEVGMLVQVNDDGTVDDNSGAGYEITGISTNTLTVGTDVPDAATAAATVVVEPFLPSITEVGAPAHAGIGTCTVGGDAADMTEATFVHENELQILANIQGTSEYPLPRYLRATKRNYSGSQISTYMRPGGHAGKAWYRHVNLTNVAVVLQVNNRSGVDAFKISCPRAFIDNPEQSGTEGLIQQCGLMPAYNSSFDNEVSYSFAAP